MGTRCITKVCEGRDGEPLVCLFRSMDGYPSEHGRDLKEFLAGYQVVNGMNMSQISCVICNRPHYFHRERVIERDKEPQPDHRFQPQKVANGVDNLALHITAHFIELLGVFDLSLEDTSSDANDNSAQYSYLIWVRQNGIKKPWFESNSPEDNTIMLVVYNYDDVIFDGELADFDPEINVRNDD